MGMMGFVKAGEKMTDKLVNTFDLGAFSDEEKMKMSIPRFS